MTAPIHGFLKHWQANCNEIQRLGLPAVNHIAWTTPGKLTGHAKSGITPLTASDGQKTISTPGEMRSHNSWSFTTASPTPAPSWFAGNCFNAPFAARKPGGFPAIGGLGCGCFWKRTLHLWPSL